MPTPQPNTTRSRSCQVAAVAPTQPVNGAAPSLPHIILSPRTPTGQLTTGFLFASPALPVSPVVVWKQETSSGFWFKLLTLEVADAWDGTEWITVCDVNATPLYFQVDGQSPMPSIFFVEEFGSSPG